MLTRVSLAIKILENVDQVGPNNLVLIVQNQELVKQLASIRKAHLCHTHFVVVDDLVRPIHQLMKSAIASFENPEWMLWIHPDSWTKHYNTQVDVSTLQKDQLYTSTDGLICGHSTIWNQLQSDQDIKYSVPLPVIVEPVSAVIIPEKRPYRLGNVSRFNYLEAEPTELCQYMEKWGSDKGNTLGDAVHTYTTFYHHMLHDLRSYPIKLFELGVGTKGILGNSMMAWRDYFKDATLYCADTDNNAQLVRAPNIYSFYCSPLVRDETFVELWDNMKEEQFDVIICSAYNVLFPGFSFAMNSLHKLKVGGVMFIENIYASNYETLIQLLQQKLGEQYQYNYEIVTMHPHPKRFFVSDNIVLMITHKCLPCTVPTNNYTSI